MTVNDIKQNNFCEKYDITSYSNSVLRLFVDKTDKRGFDNPDEKKSFFPSLNSGTHSKVLLALNNLASLFLFIIV